MNIINVWILLEPLTYANSVYTSRLIDGAQQSPVLSANIILLMQWKLGFEAIWLHEAGNLHLPADTDLVTQPKVDCSNYFFP